MKRSHLEKLLQDYEQKANAIRIVLQLFDSPTTSKNELDEKIVKHVKDSVRRSTINKPKKVHWMHKPENAGKVALWTKRMARLNRRRWREYRRTA